METNFNFKSSVCTTREQSERLLALGLKKETADMHITNMSGKGINYTDDWQIGSTPYCDAMSFLDSKGLQLEKTAWSIVPAWSLHRLIEMCDINPFVFYTNGGYGNVIYRIENLIKEGNFNKFYLVDQEALEERCKGVLEYLDYIRGEEE